jgi:hypothetical protein
MLDINKELEILNLKKSILEIKNKISFNNNSIKEYNNLQDKAIKILEDRIKGIAFPRDGFGTYDFSCISVYSAFSTLVTYAYEGFEESDRASQIKLSKILGKKYIDILNSMDFIISLYEQRNLKDGYTYPRLSKLYIEYKDNRESYADKIKLLKNENKILKEQNKLNVELLKKIENCTN